VIAHTVAEPVVGRRVVAPYGRDGDFVTVVVGRGGPLLPNGVVLTGPVGQGRVAVEGAAVWNPRLALPEDPERTGREIAAAVGTVDRVDDLIGRGPGLTPEGDDLVAGCAGVLAAAGEHDRAAALIGGDLRRRTTALSATLLELAARGMGPEPLQAVLAGRPGALARLVRLGHTSGRAYARGAAFALTSLRPR
jgi:hypothetical protein